MVLQQRDGKVERECSAETYMNGCPRRHCLCATRTSTYVMNPKPIPFVIDHVKGMIMDGLLVDMKPVAERWSDRAAVGLGGSFAAVLRSASPPRIKLCANPECGRAFYDSSKNRSRRWCDSRSCGNRARVRRHRARARGNL